MFRRYVVTNDLPEILPIFPLSGALLLPRGTLPLNIFEPRYIQLVDDVMRGERLIGMIQPRIPERLTATPPLYDIGCAGRITSYTETEDARFLITLTGLCRFRIMRELDAMTPYRQVEADFEPFANDLTAEDDDLLEEGVRERLLNALKGYLTQQKMRADWESIQHAPAEHLINALAMICPFETSEKQALLEAPTLPERAQTLITLISMSGNEPSPGEDNGTLQ